MASRHATDAARTRSTGQGARQQKAGRAAWGSILNGGQAQAHLFRGGGGPEVDLLTRNVRFQILVRFWIFVFTSTYLNKRKLPHLGTFYMIHIS